ncbi:alkaline phosphatase [Halalkalibaculum sp. DA384]|uniref:alkaline phosphatase n=1 Tax=Halalkalibaculum sp. DA384 TaxID=3373606 RepID=UPI003754E851
MSSFSRKDFLKSSALASLGIGSSVLSGKSSSLLDRISQAKGEAKNIIFMVSDGMSSGTLTLGDLVKRRQYGEATNWLELYDSTERPYHRGLMDMASLDSPVTDSAAAASSWGAGQRINNGAINMSPDGRRHKPIAEIFRDAGKKTGLVTTTRLTHATPAGFAANVPDRGMEDTIAMQYLQREFDLLMGGGARHFAPADRDDGKDLFAGFRAKGYDVIREKANLPNASRQKLLGVFSDSHLPYTIDRQNNAALASTVPTLAEMTQTALKQFNGAQNGFLLQVEGGRVDHAAHGNDAAGLIYDQIEFDEAVGVALDFASGREDTLLIITTDHGNANPAVNGTGDRYTDSGSNLDNIQQFTHSNDWILSGLDANSSVEDIRDRVKTATNLGITRQQAIMLLKSLNGELTTVYEAKNSPKAVLGSILANYLSINWLGTVHTSDYVELAVLGPGIEQMDNFTRNTDLFEMMVALAGVEKYASN